MRGRAEGRGAKTFGLRGRGGSQGFGLGSCSRSIEIGSAWCSGNGGFVRVSHGSRVAVGTVSLERSSESRRKQPFLAARRQLCGLTGRPGQGMGGIDRPAGGGGPPSAPRPFPRPLAHAIFPIWIAINDDCPAKGAEAPGILRLQTGSGERLSRSARMRARGWGSDAGWGLCRSGETSGVRVHVN
jgi:hypothetical protein